MGIVLTRQQTTGLETDREAQGTQRLKDWQYGMAGWSNKQIYLYFYRNFIWKSALE